MLFQRRFALIFACLLTVSNTFDSSIVSSEEKDSAAAFRLFDHKGIKRQYVLHLPEDLPAGAPLVVFLHGYRGDARDYAEMGMNRVANANQFAVAYPQGLPDRRGITHWNARLKISEVDDVGFLKSLAKQLQREHSLDPKRTFVSGVSNGGFMSYTMISEEPECFRAAASIIGTVSGETWAERDQFLPRPVLQISGLDDEIVPVDGSMSKLGGWGGAPKQATIMDFFRELNETRTIEVNEISDQATATRYGGGIDGNEVWFYEVKNWGHRVPGAKQLGLHSVDLVWDFFSRF
ncbi:prolyl oligopeptidase family serine peptidase [Rubripirellula sp.]|nr:prolyl oligopeptidase family serine peptidase [Rubripirellula sp.]